MAVLVDITQGERRVGNPQLSDHRTPPEPRESRRRRLAIEHLESLNDGIDGNEVVIGGGGVGAGEKVRVVAFGEVEREEGVGVGVGWAVTAAEFVLAGRLCWEGLQVVVVMVEHEIL